MDIPPLLQQLESLSHTDRMNHMVCLGRAALTSRASDNLITALSHGPLYEQILALQTCYGTRNISHAMHLVATTSSKLLRRRALDVIVTIGSNADVAQALHDLRHTYSYAHDVEHALKHLHRRKRLDVIDEFLGGLRASGEQNREQRGLFGKWLWMATPKVLSEVLPSMFEGIGAMNLTRLLRRHAELVWRVVLARAEVSSKASQPVVEPSFLRILNSLLQHTSARDHVHGALVWDLMLDVIKLLLQKFVSFSSLHTTGLERRRPLEVVQLVVERSIKDFAFDVEVLSKATAEQLLVLQKLNPGTLTTDNFRFIKREQRSAVFWEMNILWRGSDGALPLAVVGPLPFEDRVREARRHIQLPTFETEPKRRIPYAALLPWDEAMPLQEPFIGSNDADIRSQALNTQIKSVARQPAYLSSALNLVVNRRNEQDPVRYQCFLALVEVPNRIWRQEHLDLVARIIRDALDAPDLSWQSLFTLLKVVTRILLCHSKWASGQLALIIGERQRALPYIKLPPGSPVKEIIADLSDALLPVIDRLRAPDKGDLVLSTISALGAYLNYIPNLVHKLEYILENTNSLSLASQALTILHTSQPQRIPELIPRLVCADPGWVAFSSIEKWMVKHKLTDYQEIPESASRFGMVRPTIRYNWPHYQPWKTTRLQQERDLRRFLWIINDADRSASDWQKAIKLFPTLIYVDFHPLITLASDSRPVVRDTTIRVLGRLDAAQGLPALRSALQDPDQDRVRIAIYALRPALKSLTSAEALEILRAVPMSKVTVAKEIIRIARDLDTESSYEFLRSLSDQDLRRDAFIALLDALARDIKRPETFRLFQHAAKHKTPEIPLAIMQALPRADDLPEDKVLACWKQLLALFLQHPNAQVRNRAMLRAGFWGVRDDEQLLVSPLSSLLDSALPGEVQEAAFALIRLYSASHPAIVGDIFGRFVASKEYDVLGRLVGVYCKQDEAVLAASVKTTELVLEVLTRDRLTSRLRMDVVFGAVPAWEGLRVWIAEEVPGLAADALVKAEGLVERLGDWEGGVFDMEVVDRELGGSEDGQVRRLGLSALIARAKQMKGWTKELRERLEVYREDREVLVAEAAVFVELPRVEGK